VLHSLDDGVLKAPRNHEIGVGGQASISERLQRQPTRDREGNPLGTEPSNQSMENRRKIQKNLANCAARSIIGPGEVRSGYDDEPPVA
jgi:hypothetical protein